MEGCGGYWKGTRGWVYSIVRCLLELIFILFNRTELALSFQELSSTLVELSSSPSEPGLLSKHLLVSLAHLGEIERRNKELQDGTGGKGAGDDGLWFWLSGVVDEYARGIGRVRVSFLLSSGL